MVPLTGNSPPRLPIDSPSFIQLSQKTIYETIFPPIWAFIYPYVCINHRVDMLWSVAKGWGHAHPFGEKWGEMKMLLLWFLLIEHLLHGMECTTRVCWQLRTALLLYPFGLLPSSIWVQSPKSGLEWIGSCSHITSCGKRSCRYIPLPYIGPVRHFLSNEINWITARHILRYFFL